MTLPFALPDWLPWWAALAVIVPVLLFVLAFLFMPFSVFGVKGRLEGVEARLDEIQGEIRSLALRLPERYERDPRAVEPAQRRWTEDDRPPIPPARAPRDDGDRMPARRWVDEDRPAVPPARAPRDEGDPAPARRMAAYDPPPAQRPARDEPERPIRRAVDRDLPSIPPAPYGHPVEDREPPSPDRPVGPSRSAGRTEPRFGPR